MVFTDARILAYEKVSGLIGLGWIGFELSAFAGCVYRRPATGSEDFPERW